MAKLLGDYFKTRGLSSHTELFGTCDHSHIATINSNSAVDSVNSIAVQNSANFSPKGRAGSTTGSSKDLLAAPKFDISIWRMVAYGVGHFYNDLCASMWFTYLMIFLQNVLTFPGTLAGTLMFIGQIVDAISTPCVGLASDGSILPPLLRRLGRRTGWHVIGVIFITLSFPFVFNTCLPCASDSSYGWIFAWFVPFVVLFQVGWASVQVSHLALIPELSKNNNCRTAMSSLRYGSTVLANLCVFALLAAFLNSDDRGTGISPSDRVHFTNVALIVVGVGLGVTAFFYIFTREPTTGRRMSRLGSDASNSSGPMPMRYKNWLSHMQFYQVAALYTMSRLFINVSQVYFPFYITVSQAFSKKFVAILPLLSYASSFAVSTIMGVPFINQKLNRKAVYMLGCLVGIGNSVWMLFDLNNWGIYAVTILLGAAQAIILVTSLAITAQLINENTESGAFVYGSMSFLDKLANGIAYQVIQVLSPTLSHSDPQYKSVIARFYKMVMVFVPGGCLVLALLALGTLIPQNIGQRKRFHAHCDDEKGEVNTAADKVEHNEEKCPPCENGRDNTVNKF